MPTTQKPSAARGGRRGKHRKNRLKMLEAKPHWLASDAPYGEYLVDTVAMELFLRCAGLSTYGEDEFVRLFRQDVSIAASFAPMFARIRLLWRPDKLHLTNRFFDYLRAVQSSIKRNEGLSEDEILVSINPISMGKWRSTNATDLQIALRVAEKAIDDYLESYVPYPNVGGNYDWLTRNFIDECFELWCRYVQVELNNEAQVFNKLLAAAWRDVGFPTRERAGQRLEDWLADRVRKHFHDGICNARREQQERIWAQNSHGNGGAYLPLVIRARNSHVPPVIRARNSPGNGGAYLPLGLAGVSRESPGGA
jgi:hypothetical protein